MNALDLFVLAWFWSLRGASVKSTKLETALKPVAAKELAGASLARLVASGLIEQIAPAKKGKPDYRISPEGESRASATLGPEPLPFKTLRDFSLTALALNLPVCATEKKAQSAFTKLLPVAVCVRHFKLEVPLDAGADAASLALVRLALSRSNNVPIDKIHLKKLTGELPAVVAGPLLGEPQTAAGKIEKLIESKALNLLGISKTSNIKQAIIRHWLSGDTTTSKPVLRYPQEPDRTPPEPPFNLKSFATNVLEAAREVARTNPRALSNLGDKVLVHFVWQAYQRWFAPMPAELFKQHLSDANGDHLILVREDMIPEDRRQEFTDSEVRRGVSTYHYIRIGSLGVQHGGT